MKTKSDMVVVQEFKDRVNTQDLTKDIWTKLLISGGMPGESIQLALTARGNGEIHGFEIDELNAKQRREVETELSSEDTAKIFELSALAGSHLIPRFEAEFLPDEVIGSLTMGTGEQETTYFFPVNEKLEPIQDGPITMEAARALEALMNLLKRLLN